MHGMLRIYIIMGIACLGLGALAIVQGGWQHLFSGLIYGGKMLVNLFPLLLLAFVSAGLISVLSSEVVVSRWLGKESGLKGIMLGGVAGALVPGGPFIFFPLAATFLVSGAEIGTVISFVTAKNLWTFTRLPIEIALLGTKITFFRYAITFIFPIIAGLAANFFLQSYTNKIRDEIRQLQGIKKET